jgi:hypothetical protein
MTLPKTVASIALASGLLALAQGGANAAIVCDGNFQIVNGISVGTPYCREMNLAHVARSYGWKVSDDTIRYNEGKKEEVCRAIGYDRRVQDICSRYRMDNGDVYSR